MLVDDFQVEFVRNLTTTTFTLHNEAQATLLAQLLLEVPGVSEVAVFRRKGILRETRNHPDAPTWPVWTHNHSDPLPKAGEIWIESAPEPMVVRIVSINDANDVVTFEDVRCGHRKRYHLPLFLETFSRKVD